MTSRGWVVDEEGKNEDSMGPTAELICISFSSPPGFEAGVGLMWA